MLRRLKKGWAGLLLALVGCAAPQMTQAPGGEALPLVAEIENPVFIPLGHESYGQVFENVLQTLIDEGFEIQEANRYDGRVEAIPRTAPGLGLFLKPGSPDFRERLL